MPGWRPPVAGPWDGPRRSARPALSKVLVPGAPQGWWQPLEAGFWSTDLLVEFFWPFFGRKRLGRIRVEVGLTTDNQGSPRYLLQGIYRAI